MGFYDDYSAQFRPVGPAEKLLPKTYSNLYKLLDDEGMMWFNPESPCSTGKTLRMLTKHKKRISIAQ